LLAIHKEESKDEKLEASSQRKFYASNERDSQNDLYNEQEKLLEQEPECEVIHEKRSGILKQNSLVNQSLKVNQEDKNLVVPEREYIVRSKSSNIKKKVRIMVEDDKHEEPKEEEKPDIQNLVKVKQYSSFWDKV